MSALLSSDDLNDFIKPSVACIKPVEGPDLQSTSSIQISGDDSNPLEVFTDGTSKSLEPAQISLSDCLACSGCITSAEEILVAQHSHKELLNAIKNKHDTKFVASISHQSRASLALAYNVSIEVMDIILIDLFSTKFGFQYIVGTELGRLISLQQSIEEIDNYKSQKNNNNNNNNNHGGPLMSSVCPGWVLYVEKTHPEIIPNLSIVKSPQQITGCLLKHSASQSLGVPIDKVYHVSIMPCFDKKLEAARPENDGNSNNNNVNDVDCVITAKELVQLMNDENLSFENYVNEITSNPELPKLLQTIDIIRKKYSPELFKFGVESWYSNLGSASGGYAHNYINYLQKKHCSKSTEVVTINGRNEDIYEIRLVDTDSKELYGSVAIVNGFRNIQNLIRKVGELNGGKKPIRKKGGLLARRRAKLAGAAATVPAKTVVKEIADGLNCDYVEVMACPGGCINGGGQISAPGDNNVGTANAAKLWQQQSIVKYQSIVTIQDVLDDSLTTGVQHYMKDFGGYFGVSMSRITEAHFQKVQSTNVDNSAIALTSTW
ncbi:iron-sulfur cluster assembly protein [Saccharomycopsis crataegensis]|uniref:Cytosolic Fe-S cluster assembly factor NAR1 n=1 Tax=Saccharomycopsis crataegensis TaxID=43959 RepID=A0AAV5QFA4_9ASCO|nr:iron-sulfur cluster assembly protein [Saccharomycopsis crataegensis]